MVERDDSMDMESEVRSLRTRHHDLADALQTYRLQQVMQDEGIKYVKETIAHLERTAATGEQLESFKDLCARDFKALSVDMGAVQNSITWAVRIVIGSVILAVLAIVLKGNITP